jgi:hypothetical protein
MPPSCGSFQNLTMAMCMLEGNSIFIGHFNVVVWKYISPHNRMYFEGGTLQGKCNWMVELNTWGFSTDTKLFSIPEECTTPASMQTVVLVHGRHQCLLQNLYCCGWHRSTWIMMVFITLKSSIVLLETERLWLLVADHAILQSVFIKLMKWENVSVVSPNKTSLCCSTVWKLIGSWSLWIFCSLIAMFSHFQGSRFHRQEWQHPEWCSQLAKHLLLYFVSALRLLLSFLCRFLLIFQCSAVRCFYYGILNCN